MPLSLLLWLVPFFALDALAWDNDNTNEGIIIVKVETTLGDGPFNFTSLKLGSFEITTTAGIGTHQFGSLAAGTYDLSETVPPGWTLQKATCNNNSPVSAVYLPDDDQTVTCTFINQKQLSSITISQNESGTPALGDNLNFSFTVQNTGNVTLSNVAVSDNLAGLSTISCPALSGGFLAANASALCTASYIVQQSDVDTGSVGSTASVMATPPSGPNVNAMTSALNVSIPQAPSLALAIAWAPMNYTAAQQTINFTYTVTNTGNVTLDNLTILDPATCASTTLIPGASTQCTSAYTTTQSDVDADSITQIVQASAVDALESTVTANVSATATIYANQSPLLAIGVGTSPSTYSSPGQVISFTYTLTNNGNTTLNGLLVSDPSATCMTTTLLPGASTTCSSSFTVTQANIDAGSFTKTVTATSGAVTTKVTFTVNALQNPSLTIKKTASPTSYSAVGQVIDYAYLLTNSGNVTLSGPFTVSDGSLVVTCPATPSLAPGQSITCTSSYTVTQNDIDKGTITNTASGKNGSGSVVSPPATVVVGASQNATLGGVEISYNIGYSTLGKDNPSSLVLGDTVNFNFLLKNSGNTTINDIILKSDLQGLVLTCTPALPANLEPGDTLSCTASYVVSAQDVAKGSIVASVTAAATSPEGTKVTSSGSVTLSVANVCGDGVVSPSEACDDGVNNSANGSCTATCQVNTCVTVAIALASSCDQSAQALSQTWLVMVLLALAFGLRKRNHLS